MNTFRIAGLPGDGSGPEMYAPAEALLTAGNQVLGREALTMDRLPYDADYMLENGTPWPDGTPEQLARDYHAAFLTALGDPRLKDRFRSDMAHAAPIILRGFRGHPAWATNFNRRPTALWHPDLRPELIRQPFNFNLHTLNEEDESIHETVENAGQPEMSVTVEEVHSMQAFESKLRTAAKEASSSGDSTMILVHKGNVMRHSHGQWLAIRDRVAEETGIQIEDQYMDSFLERLVKAPQTIPSVVMTDIAFGKVLSRALEALKTGERGEIPEDFELFVGRENMEGMYAQQGGVVTAEGDTIGRQGGKHTTRLVRANIEATIQEARSRGQTAITVLTIEDAHPQAYGLWRRVATQVGREQGFEVNFMHAGDFVAELIRNPEAMNHRVFAADNILGDLCGDAAAALTGGLGFPATDEVNTTGETGKHFVEPLGGTAPLLRGQNRVNPTAAQLCVGELWRGFGFPELQARLERSIRSVLVGGIRTQDVRGGRATTTEYSEAVIQAFLRDSQ